jgi:hypothetical protein
MIACGFYLASLIIGKQLSTLGAGVVTTAGSYLQKTATNNLVRRPAGFVGRHSLGWAGAGAGRALRTVAPISGQRLIDASKKAKFGGLDSTASLEAERKHAKEEIRKEDVERGAKARLKTAKSDMSDAQKERDAAIARGDTAAREDADHKISSALGRLSQQEVEDLDDIKKGTEALVQNLSPQQFKNLMESKTLSEEEKTKVREARFADVNASIAKAKSSGTPADIEAAKKQLNGLTTKELEYAGQSFLEDDFVAENLTDKQYEDLSKGDALSPTAKRALKTKRESRFDASAPDAAVASRIIGMKGDIDQIGKIPPAALERPGVLASLGLREFDAIRRANKASAATRQIIGAHLNTRIDPDISRYLLTDPRAMQYFLM